MSIQQMLDAVEWTHCDTPDQLHTSDLYATHEGVLRVGELSVRVYQLNNGQRVFDSADVAALLGVSEDDMRLDYDGTPITDIGPRCTSCDRDRLEGEDVCIRHYQGPAVQPLGVPRDE